MSGSVEELTTCSTTKLFRDHRKLTIIRLDNKAIPGSVEEWRGQGPIFYIFLFFLDLLKNIEIFDKKTYYLQKNIGFFKLIYPKVGIDIFSEFFYYKTLGAFILQAQQGHTGTHPWAFRLGLTMTKQCKCPYHASCYYTVVKKWISV